MIETRLLEALLAFQEYGTLSKAAEMLHISQPSVSRAIQALEEELAVPLVTRKTNRAVLNENGQLAVEYAKRILALHTEMMQSVRALEHSHHTLSIGFCAPGPRMQLLPQLMTFFPEMQLQTEILSDEMALVHGLFSSKYQLIVSTHPYKEQRLVCLPYGTEQLYMAVSPDHPLYEKKSVDFASLNGESFLVVQDIGIWHEIIQQAMPKSQFFWQSSLEAMDTIVQSSTLPSFSTDVSQKLLPARKNRRNIPITDVAATLSFYLVFPKKLEKRFQKLIDFLEETNF